MTKKRTEDLKSKNAERHLKAQEENRKFDKTAKSMSNYLENQREVVKRETAKKDRDRSMSAKMYLSNNRNSLSHKGARLLER